MPSAWDERNPPLAYLLTFRTFGTWHHGDARGSVGRKYFNKYKAPKMKSSSTLVEVEEFSRKGDAFILDAAARQVVSDAITGVCEHREYQLDALNVRSNHVHVVVSQDGPPEKIVEAFKSYSTRALRENGLVDEGTKVWARHCSTRYLWTLSSVEAARNYCLYFQGDEFPSFDEVLDS